MDASKSLAIVSANLGNFDKSVAHCFQDWPRGFSRIEVKLVTDDDFPPRLASMTPRLQSRIVKTHMWEFMPGFDYYLWVDSSCRLPVGDSSDWFVRKLGAGDIAVFKHPHRKTVQEEANYLKHRLNIKCPYITPRYKDELIDEQLTAVEPDEELFASTAFIFRNSYAVRSAMKDWWYHISRYHSIDQLSLPWAIRDLDVRIIEENYLKTPYLEYIRNQK